jgi:hypothetical protein
MKKIIYFLTIILDSNCKINNQLNDTCIKYEFSNKELNKEFQAKKENYMFVREYFDLFLENKKISTKRKLEKIHFIKKKYLVSFTEERQTQIIKIFQMLDNLLKNLFEIPLNIDWENQTIKEEKYKDVNKYIGIVTETMISLLVSYDFLDDKKIEQEECDILDKICRNYEKFNTKNQIQIKKSTKFQDLTGTYNNKISNLNKNIILKDFLDIFIGEIAEHKDYINNNIWPIIEFMNNIYEEYHDKKLNNNKKLEILKKVFDFKENNQYLKNIKNIEIVLYQYMNILLDILINNIEEEDGKKYFWEKINTYKYSRHMILDMEKYKQIIIIYLSLNIIFIILKYHEKKINETQWRQYEENSDIILGKIGNKYIKLVETYHI